MGGEGGGVVMLGGIPEIGVGGTIVCCESVRCGKNPSARGQQECILAMWVRVLDQCIILIGVRPGRE